VKTPSLLQVVEKLERLAGRLPSKIRNAVLSELTPLKQLFLQQRPPRFIFAGSAKVPARKIISALFGSTEFAAPDAPAPLCRWFEVDFPERGKISIIDVRGVVDSAAIHVRDELKYRAADIIFFIHDERVGQELEKRARGLVAPRRLRSLRSVDVKKSHYRDPVERRRDSQGVAIRDRRYRVCGNGGRRLGRLRRRRRGVRSAGPANEGRGQCQAAIFPQHGSLGSPDLPAARLRRSSRRGPPRIFPAGACTGSATGS